MLTCAVRDLKLTKPDLLINVGTSASYLWDNNPYLSREVSEKSADLVIDAGYPLINRSNSHTYHFIHGFRLDLATKLGIPIKAGPHTVDIHLSSLELVKMHPDLPERYWLLNAGHKNDFTAKMWEYSRYAEVVERLQGIVTFVQIGLDEHTHKPIPGAINMLGKTNGRKLIPIMYRAAGVVTGVSFPMHLSTMPVVDGVSCGKRPCVCIAGAREPITWIQQPNMHALHVCGMLDCCREGGCWKSRVAPLNDGSNMDKSICANPVTGSSGQIIPKCMDMISVDDVVNKILQIEESFMCNCKKSGKDNRITKVSNSKPTLVSDVVDSATTPTIPKPNVSTVMARQPNETRLAYLHRLKATSSAPIKSATSSARAIELSAEQAAEEINLEQCYLCAKKHVGRAQIFFEEYHTGYDDRVKRLIESLQVSEGKVKEAFLLKEKIQAHLDMASGELLGNGSEGSYSDDSHVATANAIRDERLKLQDDPMYIPKFSELLESIHKLQYAD